MTQAWCWPLPSVEQSHEVAGIDPQGGAELLLRERSRQLEVVQNGKLVTTTAAIKG